MIKSFRAVILGAPGSGKGTISSRIVRKFEMKHISSGDILRNHILNKTPLGLDAKKYMDKGQLVPDEVMIGVVLSEIEKSSGNNWLLDGFPRTRKQAEILYKKAPIDAAMNLVVPFDVIIDRIQKRWVHLPSGRVYNIDFNAPKTPGLDDVTGEKLVQRDDDKPESVQKRLDIYSKTLGPVLEFYKEEGILEEFSGRTSDEIWPSVFKYLQSHLTPITQDIKV
uniref:GTP:AMP phosphotransferase, mitochondrial n=1 Tax=Riptortus pedestris TaxID=329032 RepID=R4WSG6_RIPPE|nr:adenylate kinase 3 [Riptortus pedestris]